jgi:metallo-beta-lactamase class B
MNAISKSCSALLLASAMALSSLAAQLSVDTEPAHVKTAETLAGADFVSVFKDVCFAPAPAPTEGRAATATPAAATIGADQEPTLPRSVYHVEPVKVFDNLIYLGQSEFSAWAVTTSAGIIVVDSLFEYSVEDEIVDGLKKLGLNPADIKYVIVTHAHRDHAAGAKLLQDRFGARVIMSEADWNFMAGLKQSWPMPKRDLVATDGQKLTLGDTTLTLFVTPGHTPGSLSLLIPVSDRGVTHLAAEWGGTGMSFRTNPGSSKRYWFDTYGSSVRRFRDIVAKAGTDVMIANHPNQDGAKAKLAKLAQRRAGETHPFVIGGANIKRYLTMLDECAQAGSLRNVGQ